MTLKGYYESLPEPTKPKYNFLMEVVNKCGVRQETVYNWINGKTKPSEPRHIAVLCELTGLKEEELWQEG